MRHFSIPASTLAPGPNSWDHYNLAKPEEVRYSGSLIATLHQQGTPGFAVETSLAATLDTKELDRVADGLYRVMQTMQMIDGRSSLSSVTAYKRTVVTSDTAGLWEPELKLLQAVADTDQVGTITSLDLNTDYNVMSKHEGTLIQIARRQVVDTGTSIFAVGSINHEVTGLLHAAVVNQSEEG